MTKESPMMIELAAKLGGEWHERAGECCLAENEELPGISIEWYSTVSYLTNKTYNVKVCYRLPGMSGYNHIDTQISEAKAGNLSYMVDNYVRMLKQFARDGIQAGYKVAKNG